MVWLYRNVASSRREMATIVTVAEKNEAWINARVESGDYGNASEYIRDLIRRD